MLDQCTKLSDRVRIQSELEEAGLDVDALEKRYREDSSTFEIPYFVAKFVAKVRAPDVATGGHPILTLVKLSSQP
ncbi:hypothetical protein AVEN_200207-1 [Araneus ventricosus]|uniref:Uncharacterized protein n=1 Tax=Araneus ventricosus TaxID=182803 RepID=A0A4Y2BGA1_ARAVE|nr:hypothetical protein AVEN_178447-1 [Araneus ventricosus]GBL90169.1 hypothetical protein AVEN_200207-1 [Araneus ventricosus]